MNLLIDPDLLAAAANSIGRPNAYISRHGGTATTFGYYPADPTTGPRCERCKDLLHNRLWQFVNGGEVIDCGRQAQVRYESDRPGVFDLIDPTLVLEEVR